MVLGAGDVGTFIARELSGRGHDVVLVDQDEAALSRAEEVADVLAMGGSVTRRSVLRRAEVERSNLAIAVTGSDETNIVAAGLAAALGAKRVVARVDDPEFYESVGGVEHGVLGVHSLVCASRLVCDDLIRLVARVDADYVGHFAGNAVNVTLLPVGASCPLLGQPASQLRLSRGVRAAAILRDRQLRRLPEVDTIELDDALVLTGTSTDVLRATLELQTQRAARRAVVVGAGDVGTQLARRLRLVGESVVLIEQDRERCEVVAGDLDGVRVVQGDGTSLAVLSEEHAELAAYSLSVTRADEINLMSALVLRDLGVPDVFALVHRPGYADVYSHLGIRATAGAHDAILGVVQRMLPGAGILGQDRLGDSGFDVLEMLLPGTVSSGLILADCPLPPDALCIAAVRAGVSLPVGPKTELKRRDVLVVAAPHHKRREVERAVRNLRRRVE